MDWIIAGISGLFIGGFFGVFGMAILSGRAYEKGKSDSGDKNFSSGYQCGYQHGYRDYLLADVLADEVIFTSKTDNEGD